MPQKAHLNGSERDPPKNAFLTPKMSFPDYFNLDWHGMENGQKPEMEKKNWKSKWKTAPSWTGAQKWPKNGKIMENSLKKPFFGPFFLLPFLPLSSLGPFSISISISGFWTFSMPYRPGKIPSLGLCKGTLGSHPDNPYPLN